MVGGLIPFWLMVYLTYFPPNDKIRPDRFSKACQVFLIMTQYLLAPSIIASDFTRLADEVAACRICRRRLDSRGCHGRTFRPDHHHRSALSWKRCKRVTKLPLDVHLMISEPEKYIPAFAEAGADNITVHVETCPDLPRVSNRSNRLAASRCIT
jgi:pentose-5-phosphate-3-epimerase